MASDDESLDDLFQSVGKKLGWFAGGTLQKLAKRSTTSRKTTAKTTVNSSKKSQGRSSAARSRHPAQGAFDSCQRDTASPASCREDTATASIARRCPLKELNANSPSKQIVAGDPVLSAADHCDIGVALSPRKKLSFDNCSSPALSVEPCGTSSHADQHAQPLLADASIELAALSYEFVSLPKATKPVEEKYALGTHDTSASNTASGDRNDGTSLGAVRRDGVFSPKEHVLTACPSNQILERLNSSSSVPLPDEDEDGADDDSEQGPAKQNSVKAIPDESGHVTNRKGAGSGKAQADAEQSKLGACVPITYMRATETIMESQSAAGAARRPELQSKCILTAAVLYQPATDDNTNNGSCRIAKYDVENVVDFGQAESQERAGARPHATESKPLADGPSTSSRRGSTAVTSCPTNASTAFTAKQNTPRDPTAISCGKCTAVQDQTLSSPCCCDSSIVFSPSKKPSFDSIDRSLSLLVLLPLQGTQSLLPSAQGADIRFPFVGAPSELLASPEPPASLLLCSNSSEILASDMSELGFEKQSVCDSTEFLPPMTPHGQTIRSGDHNAPKQWTAVDRDALKQQSGNSTPMHMESDQKQSDDSTTLRGKGEPRQSHGRVPACEPKWTDDNNAAAHGKDELAAMWNGGNEPASGKDSTSAEPNNGALLTCIKFWQATEPNNSCVETLPPVATEPMEVTVSTEPTEVTVSALLTGLTRLEPQVEVAAPVEATALPKATVLAVVSALAKVAALAEVTEPTRCLSTTEQDISSGKRLLARHESTENRNDVGLSQNREQAAEAVNMDAVLPAAAEPRCHASPLRACSGKTDSGKESDEPLDELFQSVGKKLGWFDSSKLHQLNQLSVSTRKAKAVHFGSVGSKGRAGMRNTDSMSKTSSAASALSDSGHSVSIERPARPGRRNAFPVAAARKMPPTLSLDDSPEAVILPPSKEKGQAASLPASHVQQQETGGVLDSVPDHAARVPGSPTASEAAAGLPDRSLNLASSGSYKLPVDSKALVPIVRLTASAKQAAGKPSIKGRVRRSLTSSDDDDDDDDSRLETVLTRMKTPSRSRAGNPVFTATGSRSVHKAHAELWLSSDDGGNDGGGASNVFMKTPSRNRKAKSVPANTGNGREPKADAGLWLSSDDSGNDGGSMSSVVVKSTNKRKVQPPLAEASDDGDDSKFEALLMQMKTPSRNHATSSIAISAHDRSMDCFIVSDGEISTASSSAVSPEVASSYLGATGSIQDRERKTDITQWLLTSDDDDDSGSVLSSDELQSCSSDDGSSEDFSNSAILPKKPADARSPMSEASVVAAQSHTPSLTRAAPICSFLRSLDSDLPVGAVRDPNSLKFLANFNENRDELTMLLFKLFDDTVFENMLKDVPVSWSKLLPSTAGYCYPISTGGQRTAKIKLSEKLLLEAGRLRDTLLHEMCHAANWMTCGIGGHGQTWKMWGQLARSLYPELPPMTRCHSYKVASKYKYQCVNCGKTYGRQRMSIDITRKVCGVCRGTLRIFAAGKSA